MRRYGLVGKRISYSFSPGYFRGKFEELGLSDCTYQLFDLPDIEDFPLLIRKYPDLRGLNVTIPYKQAVIPFLDRLEGEAKHIGAVNTIRISGSECIGYNTDVTGFRESLAPLLRDNDRRALILGTGGASRAVARGLEQLQIEYRYVSRQAGGAFLSYSELDKSMLGDYQLLINATPLGTFPNIGDAPDIPYEGIGSSHLLFDLIYNPPQTTFLKRGSERGARTLNGMEMLRLQAEASWEIWNS